MIEGENTDDVDIIIRPNSSRSINSAATGNNLLNSNLSGSFREENEIPNDSDDDDILDDRVRRPPRRNRKHRSAPNILASDQPSTSYNALSSSTAAPGERLGVAAIPNNNQFNASRSGRGNSFI